MTGTHKVCFGLNGKCFLVSHTFLSGGNRQLVRPTVLMRERLSTHLQILSASNRKVTLTLIHSWAKGLYEVKFPGRWFHKIIVTGLLFLLLSCETKINICFDKKYTPWMGDDNQSLKPVLKLVSYLMLSTWIPDISDLKSHFCMDSSAVDFWQIGVFYFLF